MPGPIIASPALMIMIITKRSLVLALLAGSAFGLLVRASLGDSESARAKVMQISTSSCSADLGGWLNQPQWPADEVLLGDQIYSRARLSSLSYSQGNPVADLGLSLATAQLNMAAGARPSTELVDALFEADEWLLDNHVEERRSQREKGRLLELSWELNAFNRWAADLANCTSNLSDSTHG